MKIQQILSNVCGPERNGKWYCADSADGTDGYVVNRYLQHNGEWGKTTRYFNTREEIDLALAVGHKPCFSLSRQELDGRAMVREDLEYGFGDPWEDDRDGTLRRLEM